MSTEHDNDAKPVDAGPPADPVKAAEMILLAETLRLIQLKQEEMAQCQQNLAQHRQEHRCQCDEHHPMTAPAQVIEVMDALVSPRFKAYAWGDMDYLIDGKLTTGRINAFLPWSYTWEEAAFWAQGVMTDRIDPEDKGEIEWLYPREHELGLIRWEGAYILIEDETTSFDDFDMRADAANPTEWTREP